MMSVQCLGTGMSSLRWGGRDEPNNMPFFVFCIVAINSIVASDCLGSCREDGVKGVVKLLR